MKIKLLALCIILSITLSGCSKDESIDVLSTTVSQIDMKSNGHKEQLADYNSPYTICYENNDNTYSMYIFASPIQYLTDEGEYAIIDNTVIESSKEGFVFENKANSIKTYFPKTLSEPFLIEKDDNYMEFKPDWNIYEFSVAEQTIFTNMYGDKVSAVIYSTESMDLVFYPTKAGIKTEFVLKEKPESNVFSFSVKSSASSHEDKQNGYILFKEGGDIESIIYQPLVHYTADDNQKLDVTAQMNIERKEDEYNVTIEIDESIIGNANSKNHVKLDPSFEMYLNKMPDSTVYSKHDVNNYLANYAVVGEHPVFGEGWHYLRLRLRWFMTIKSNHLLEAKYCIKILDGFECVNGLNLNKPLEQWTSTQLDWNSKPDIKKTLGNVHVNNDICIIDLKYFVQDCFSDKTSIMESKGIIFTEDKSEEYITLATYDNSLYSPFFMLKLEKLPIDFFSKTNINPQD